MKRTMTCSCGEIENKRRFLNSHAHTGLVANLSEGKILINKTLLTLENNYCPQCGSKIKKEERKQTLKMKEHKK